MRRCLKSLFPLFLLLMMIGCSRRSGDIGTAENPIRFFFMPLKGLAAFEQHAPEMEKFLEEQTGFEIETHYAPDFVTIVKAFGQKRADIAFMNTLGFLLAHDYAKAEAHLRYVYAPKRSFYQGVLFVRADSKMKTPQDLNGKRFAFVDPYSTTGYLYALDYLKEHQITPAEKYFAGGHFEAVKEVYLGKADATFVYHAPADEKGRPQDARVGLVELYPDIFKKVKILDFTDQMPTGPIAFRRDLPSKVKERLAEALLTFSQSEQGKKRLNDLYNIVGFTTTRDEDYKSVQRTLSKLGKTVQEMVPGGEPYYKTSIVIGLE